MERRDFFRGTLAAGLLGTPQLPSHMPAQDMREGFRTLHPDQQRREGLLRSYLGETVLGNERDAPKSLQAQVAYSESLSAVEYLRERYGMGEVVRMLRNIGSGVEPELAPRPSTGMDYSAFQQRIGEYLAKAGGN
ncbi:MAG: hypothetical protein ACRD20_04760 [Terriglobales bacterium]